MFRNRKRTSRCSGPIDGGFHLPVGFLPREMLVEHIAEKLHRHALIGLFGER